jgi:hypothetical protein
MQSLRFGYHMKRLNSLVFKFKIIILHTIVKDRFHAIDICQKFWHFRGPLKVCLFHKVKYRESGTVQKY